MGHRRHCPTHRCTSQSPGGQHGDGDSHGDGSLPAGHDDDDCAKDGEDDDDHLLRYVGNHKVGSSETDTSIFLDIPENHSLGESPTNG